ncbi:menaquinone-dependent protoporphyrinogen IX dehydrogenase [Winogradskyella psychrotolerans]|uniref:menaquinone-dependent protoporphyrinogen IX dehydrogenase n=1 Tax=Winogradskyella psychrotolerans TaxID=1344585 RepID=UPI001C06ED27|nr:menaquinone-dependent protoporphyrinogen IX dehydrogenase [Winogradskyella psychrotolerans]MBU2930075.1 menaquinone-dependent protoporphyrinogen IX dehydrogenase [Winogradskyella psychrotolerans]
MSQKIGIIYSSIDGQTKKICEKLHAFFNNQQIKSELYAIDNFNRDISEFNPLILGASIRYGKHNKRVYDFVQNNITSLNKVTTAFFSVNLVARKEDKNSTATNPYLIKFLKQTPWKPDLLEVFAGKLDYKSYPILDRIMIKLIMKLTHGPTNSDLPIEFTNWNKVNNFGLRISNTLKAQ